MYIFLQVKQTYIILILNCILIHHISNTTAVFSNNQWCLWLCEVATNCNIYFLHLFLFHQHRQNTVLVSANDIVITSVEQTDDGIQVTFFVRGGSGEVITANAVVEAVQVIKTA